MNSFDNLYQQFKRKQYQKQLLQQQNLQKIKMLSSYKKTNRTSNKILIQKFITQLEQFQQSQIVNLDSSIPLLYKCGIFKVLTDMQDAKEKMKVIKSQSEIQHSRLKAQAKFVYFLWKMIDQEEVQWKVIKQVLILLYEKLNQSKIAELFEILYSNENFSGNREDIQMVVDSWKTLNQDRQYYNSPAAKMGNIMIGNSFLNFKHANGDYEEDQNEDSEKQNRCHEKINEKQSSNSIKNYHQKIQKNHQIQMQMEGLQFSQFQPTQEALRNQMNNICMNTRKQLKKSQKIASSQQRQKSKSKSSRKQLKVNKDNSINNHQELQENTQQKYELTVQKTKELIQRLYRPQIVRQKQEKKRLKEQQKLKEQLEACTFKPKLENKNYYYNKVERGRSLSNNYASNPTPTNHSKIAKKFTSKMKNNVSNIFQPKRDLIEKSKEKRNKVNSKSLEKIEIQKHILKTAQKSSLNSNAALNSQIKGYQKTVQRLRVANQKTKQLKQRKQFKGVGQNYEKIKQKGINPPKFLSRKKQQQQILFVIQFQLGRHKIKVKIRPNDNQQEIAKRICQIYCLKNDYYDKICEIVKAQLLQFYLEKQYIERQQHQDDKQNQIDN